MSWCSPVMLWALASETVEVSARGRTAVRSKLIVVVMNWKGQKGLLRCERAGQRVVVGDHSRADVGMARSSEGDLVRFFGRVALPVRL